MRRTPLVAVLAATVLSAAGCGLSDNDIHPGAAAEVEGDRLELRDVDSAVVDYCALRAANEQASALPTALVRGQFVTGWSQATAVEHLADEYGVALPSEEASLAAVEAMWGELGEIDDGNLESFQFLTWIQERLSTSLQEVGAAALEEEGGSAVTGDEAGQRGIALVTEWLEEHDLSVNPTFGTYDAESQAFAGDLLSVPVSAEAVDAQKTEGMSAEQVAALPESQRCGPAVAAAPGA